MSRRGFGAIRKLPSGRYQASFVGPDLVRTTAPETFTAKVDAEGWLVDRRRAIENGGWSAQAAAPQDQAPEPTLEAYFNGWIAQRELTSRTRAEYVTLARRYLLPTLGGKRLSAIRPATVRDWYSSLDPGKPTQRSHCYGLLRTVLSTALQDELISTNPVQIRRAGTSKRVHTPRPATLAEIQQIAGDMPDRLTVMILLAAWCALRFGELTELRRGDVDLKAGVVHVRRGVTRVSGEDFVVGLPKSDAGRRDVSVPPHLLRPVQNHLDRHVAARRDALLFPSSGDPDRHLAPASLYKTFYRARQAAGRPDLRFHDLRHSGATMAAQAGASLAELMGRLGHSTPGAAMRYQHVAGGRDAQIARALSEMAARSATQS